jgi:membrane protein DedA with SNARE-associated domain
MLTGLKKLLLLLLGVLWMPALVFLFKDRLLLCIHQSPALDAIYGFCLGQITGLTVVGQALLQFLGNLFIIMFLPKYAVFFYFLRESASSVVVLLLGAAGGMFLAMLVNYICGYILCFLFKRLLKSSDGLAKWLQKWGAWLVFLGYLVPIGFPHGLVSVLSGVVHVKFKRFVLAVFWGSLAYFTVLYVIYVNFSARIEPILKKYVEVFH